MVLAASRHGVLLMRRALAIEVIALPSPQPSPFGRLMQIVFWMEMGGRCWIEA